MTDSKHSKRITILQSFGTTICHVPTNELQKIAKLGTARRKLEFEGANIQVHDLRFDASLVKFMAHWIHHRDSEEAINVTLLRSEARVSAVLDEEWLNFLIQAMNSFDDPSTFTCDIIDSLIDTFILFAIRGGHAHIAQVYQICRYTCETQTLARVFANIFIHAKKTFAKQEPTCDYDRAVQKNMHEWLADVLINNKDWDKLPPQLGHPTHNVCFHHKHEKDTACYVHGGIVDKS
jgi:hypothetical protein